MNIGEAAAATGLTAKAIRYYESIDLIARAERSQGGYRQYSERDVQTLRFIRRARDLGFSVELVAELLSLYRDRSRTSSEVKRIVQTRIAEIERKMAELGAMRTTLLTLAERCHGDERPDCPILEDFAGPFGAPAKSAGVSKKGELASS
ncbi:MAG: Cu(I)-responsive transcriptional regulator [Alphaproteobacteria bacterium]|nr:Cu(I)-responsive transcriptional regulator [Alphaproteobacteria bacterium]